MRYLAARQRSAQISQISSAPPIKSPPISIDEGIEIAHQATTFLNRGGTKNVEMVLNTRKIRKVVIAIGVIRSRLEASEGLPRLGTTKGTSFRQPLIVTELTVEKVVVVRVYNSKVEIRVGSHLHPSILLAWRNTETNFSAAPDDNVARMDPKSVGEVS